jgi:PAS domain S-box-containing protein
MFRLMVESVKDYALIMLDAQGNVITWNAGAQRITGYTAEQILGRSYSVLYTPEDIAAGAPQQQRDEAARTGRFESEGWRVRNDGSRFWAGVVTTAIRDSAGLLRGFTKVTRDLTEQRSAEQRLRDSAAQIQGVINTAVDGIIAIDERGRIEWLNPAALRIFGYSAEELIGQNVHVLMPEPYHSQHNQYLSNYRQTGQAKIIGIGREVQGRRKDGTAFPIDLAISEVRLGDRRMFTGIVRDITQRKEAERLLVEAKEAAEAASRAKDQFLAIVSHELRTPLTPILGAVSFLESKADLDLDTRDVLSTIRRNVQHEAQLVDDLLNLTRLSRGKIELHHEVLDAHTLLRNLLTEFEAEFDGKKLALVTALRARDRHIWADPHRIQQVFSNLLSNAIKFTPEGGQISVRTLNADGDRLRIEFADSGIGIEPELLDRLFRPFEQGEKTITRRYGGLGLGLAISKGIVDLHGGKLAAYSEGKDKGATFVLEFCNVTAAEGPVSPAVHDLKGVKLRVLLVEDHQDTLRVMGKMLKAMGCTVIPAASVREAVELAETEPFDVLVSDIGLPDGSGVDIIQRLQAKQKTAIKAIALSGFGQPEDLLRSRDAGFMDHLVKPIDFHRLETLLKQVADN